MNFLRWLGCGVFVFFIILVIIFSNSGVDNPVFMAFAVIFMIPILVGLLKLMG